MASKWRRNFIVMASFFSISEATVTTPVSYATALLDPQCAKIGTGTVFLLVVFSALLVGPVLVKSIGPKQSLLVGMTLDTIYAVLFALATMFEPNSAAQWASYMTGAICSGFGSGIIWVAQGTFFACTVDLVASVPTAPDAPAPQPRASTAMAERTSSARHSMVWTAPSLVYAADDVLQPRGSLATGLGVEYDKERQAVTAELGGSFAAIYLATSVLMEVSSSLIQGHFLYIKFSEPVMDIFPMFVLYASASLLTVFLVVTLIANPATPALTRRSSAFLNRSERGSMLAEESIGEKVSAAFRLWHTPELWCLSFTNFTFGFSAAFMNGYINGSISAQSPTFGRESIGTLMAMTSLVAAVFSLVFAWLGALVGKGVVIFAGALSFAAIPLLVLVGHPDETNDYWGIGIIGLYVLQGLGRSVYESTNKAVFADFFPGQKSAGAFANCFMQNGLAFFLSFILQSILPSIQPVGYIVLTLACLTAPGFVVAALLTRRNRDIGRAPLTPKHGFGGDMSPTH